MTKRKYIPEKTKRILYQECKSMCSDCSNEDTNSFEFHHIDNNPANNSIENLLVLCSNCHKKYTNGIKTKDDAIKTKQELPSRNNIEIVSINIDKDNCSWVMARKNVFYNQNNHINTNPIFIFCLCNNSNKTIILSEIRVTSKSLFSDLGDSFTPTVLSPLIKYKIELPYDDTNSTILKEPLSVPVGQGFMFNVELYDTYPIRSRFVVVFEFLFGNNTKITTSKIFLNTDNEDNNLVLNTLE